MSATGQIRVIATTTGRFYGQHMRGGRIYTVAGGGEGGGPTTSATAARPPRPSSAARPAWPSTRAATWCIAGKPSSNLLEHGPSRVRIVAVVSGTFYGVPMTAGDIYTVAGTSKQGYAGDGGPATAAELSPADAVASTAGIYIADAANGRVRFVRS